MLEELVFDVKFTHNKNNTRSKNAFFIEGGGTKGVYAIGILKYLFNDNPYIMLSKIDIFGGTSVGSYLTTPLSLGYQSDDFGTIANVINLSELIDSKYLFMVTLYRFFSYGYLYNDDGRKDIIAKILDHGINKIKNHLDITDNNFTGKDLTFGHLKMLIEKYPNTYKHLIINTVDISRNEQLFMTTLNDKWINIKLYDGMLASSAIPGIFKHSHLYYCPDTDRYGYNKVNGAEEVWLVDGGVCTNNPMDYFLLNHSDYVDYNFWLLKFSNLAPYTKIDGTYSFLKQLAIYLISGKNDVKRKLIEDEYKINIINLHSNTSLLKIYTHEQILTIIEKIYQKCLSGELYFGN